MMHEDPFEMCVSIVFAGTVVPVAGFGRGELFKPFPDILVQPMFVIVNDDTACNMHRAYKDKSLADPESRTNFSTSRVIGTISRLFPVLNQRYSVWNIICWPPFLWLLWGHQGTDQNYLYFYTFSDTLQP